MITSIAPHSSAVRRQRGIALFVALVILLVITLAGVFGLQTTRMEERMAANARDHDIAFQAAEAALSAGEVFIEGDPDLGIDGIDNDGLAAFENNTDGLFVPADPDDPQRWEEVDWEADEGLPLPDDIDGLAQQPQFIVERVAQVLPPGGDLVLSNIGEGGDAPTDIFRITTFATGGSGTARVMLQTTYGKQIQ